MLYRTGLALGALIAAPSLAAAPAGLAGRWKTDDGKGIVAMAPCGGRMCGRIERLLIEEPPGGQRDVRNPDAAKRSRKVEGLQIYWDLVRTGDGWKGQGYSPEDGRYYTAHLRVKGDRLTMKGCVSIFCRTVTWTRIA
ncbi:DUF2147 domain-containing protein [Sphingopyxis indica]|uniref:Uncharacterized conserved protein, DUF2147 family n=1 Tax=Sphingopyxis indica TaxID=436663 RepID=A0A239E8W0_9SPHN|nr:DUF2147 domain-containing protein [Sphingopyxis indica]WOF41639.1 DUF2147 domain-containing protein [Sphingopyxis indica]SNS40463.1 Uncharacterized conserved protein, DUF2147 family [Sphingopyxis indica]